MHRSATRPFATIAWLGRPLAAGIAVASLALGLYLSAPLEPGVAPRWKVLALSLHAVPLVGLLIPMPLVRVYALWFGVFLLLQFAATPVVLGAYRDHRTLPSNMDETFDVVGDGLPGIRGRQHVTTDHLGFRATPPIDYQSRSGFRIFAVGGSTTEQIHLDDRATWTFLLQQRLNEQTPRRVEVVNTGLSGLRARHHLSTLQRISALNPDCVLFMLGANDWIKHIREHFGSRHYEQQARQLNSFEWTLLGRGIRAVLAFLKSRLAEARGEHRSLPVRVETGDYYTRQRDSLSRPVVKTYLPEQVAASYRDDLDAISDRCKRIEATCVFLTQPNGYDPAADRRFLKSFWMTPPNEEFTLDLRSMAHIAELYNGFLIRWAEDRGHEVIDLAGRIEPGFQNFFDDLHFNTNGARHVAAVLADHLSRGTCGLDRARQAPVARSAS